MSRWLFLLCGLLMADLVAGEEFRASVAWPRTVELGPAISGVVSEVHVRPGQRVEKDAPLLTLDARVLAARAAGTRAGVAGAEIGLDEATRELDRAEDLFERDLISEHDLELVRIETAKAEAAHAKAAAETRIAELNLRNSVLRSPISGLVVAVDAFPGQYIAVGFVSSEVVTLAETDTLVARAEVDGAVLDGLKEGTRAEVLIGGEVLPGEVYFIGLQALRIESGVPRYELSISFPPPAPPPRVGRIVSVRIP